MKRGADCVSLLRLSTVKSPAWPLRHLTQILGPCGPSTELQESLAPLWPLEAQHAGLSACGHTPLSTKERPTVPSSEGIVGQSTQTENQGRSAVPKSDTGTSWSLNWTAGELGMAVGPRSTACWPVSVWTRPAVNQKLTHYTLRLVRV